MKFLFFYLISLSFIGYGTLVINFLKLRYYNFGILGILGITLIAIISFSSSLFLNHGHLFNSLTILIGFILFLINLKRINQPKKEILNHFIIFMILCLFILIAKNHDDFSYYHFPYITLLTEFQHPIGIGQLNNGFRSPSSIFFISSLFYLPGVGIYIFHIFPALVLGFVNLILLNKIFDQGIFKRKKIVNFLSLASLVFINIFFYRLAEHGTDRTGMILIILAIIFLVSLIYDQKSSEHIDEMKIFILMISFVATIKPFYFLNLLLLIILIINPLLRKNFLNLFFSRTFYYCCTLIFLIIFFTYLNSGCLVFPATFTCFENLSWSLNKEHINETRIWFELWSKAGASPNYVVDDKIEYVSQFNWISNWIDKYFFNKVSDFLLGIITLSIIFILFFYKKNNYRFVDNKKLFSVYTIILIFFLEWFLNHPTLRYGGYHLIFLIFLLPVCSYMSFIKLNYPFFRKRAAILITITLLIFVFRNFQRLTIEIDKYNFNPLINSNYKFTEDKNFYFRYNQQIKDNLNNYKKKKIAGKEFLILSFKQK